MNINNCFLNAFLGTIQDPACYAETLKIGLKIEPSRLESWLCQRNVFCFDEEHKAELAKAAAVYRPDWILSHLQEFNLSEESRFQIVHSLPQTRASEVIERIQLFQLSAAHREQIANSQASLYPGEVVEKIDQFNLPNPFNTILKCAETSAFHVLRGSRRFSTEEIWKIAACGIEKNGAIDVSRLFQQGAVLDRIGPLFPRLCFLFASQHPLSLSMLSIKSNGEKKPWEKLAYRLLRDLQNEPSSFPSEKRIESLAAALPEQRRIEILNPIREILEPDHQIKVLFHLALFNFLYEKFLPHRQIECLYEAGIITEIASIRSAPLCLGLFRIAGELALKWKDLESLGLSNLPSSHKLFRMILANLEIANPDKIFGLARADLKNGRKLRSLLQGLERLDRESLLDLKEKQKILEQLFAAPDFISAVKALDLVLKGGKIEELKRLSAKNPIEQIAHACAQKTAVPKGLPEIKFEAYENTFGCYRQPEAALAYSKSLETLQDRSLTDSFLSHVFSVIDNTYSKNRYNNDHLNSFPSDLVSQWEQNIVYAPNEVLLKEEGEIPLERFFFVKTDNPEDILLCGTEIPNSCQAVGENPKFSKGLLGYLHHGQTQLLAIKAGPKGPIAARAIFRLLMDDKQNPVLFLEPHYSKYNDPRIAPAFIAMAKKTAEQLKLPVTVASDQGPFYPSPLHSLGGPAPFEYSDSAGGLFKNGEFSIQNASILC